MTKCNQIWAQNKHYILTFNNYIIVTDMEGNIRIYRLPKAKGCGMDHDPRAVCLS